MIPKVNKKKKSPEKAVYVNCMEGRLRIEKRMVAHG